MSRKVVRFVVVGPEVEKVMPSEGAAYAFALDWASRTGEVFYVREYEDVIARAEGGENGTAVLVRRAA